MSATPVVLCLPEFRYKRFSGKTMTHHAKANRDLTPEEVEAFRVAPDKCMEPDEAPTEGNAA